MQVIENILQTILDTLNSIPAVAWEVAIESVVGAVITSGAFVGIKKWFSISSEKKMVVLVMLGSIFMGGLAYLRGVPNFAPWFAFVEGIFIFAASQPVFFLFVKPTVRKIVSEVEKAVRFNSELKSAVEPAGGLTPAPAAPTTIAETVELQEFNG